jgi:hypothetical protein
MSGRMYPFWYSRILFKNEKSMSLSSLALKSVRKFGKVVLEMRERDPILSTGAKRSGGFHSDQKANHPQQARKSR